MYYEWTKERELLLSREETQLQKEWEFQEKFSYVLDYRTTWKLKKFKISLKKETSKEETIETESTLLKVEYT